MFVLETNKISYFDEYSFTLDFKLKSKLSHRAGWCSVNTLDMYLGVWWSDLDRDTGYIDWRLPWILSGPTAKW